MNSYKEACRHELEQLVARERQLDAALLCTSDGLPIVYAASIEIEADALAAMCSSMLSLGDALSIQGRDNACIQVVTQSENQTVAIIHAGEDALLALIGGRDLRLGMLLTHARKQVDIIVDLIDKYNREEQAAEKQAAASNETNPIEELVKRVIEESQGR